MNFARVIVVTLVYLALGRHVVRSGVELLLVVRGGLLDQQPGVRDRFFPLFIRPLLQ